MRFTPPLNHIRKIPSMKVTDIARAVNETARQDVIGIRPAEKIHEIMVSEEDSFGTYEYELYYKILPTLKRWHQDPDRIKDEKRLTRGLSTQVVLTSKKCPLTSCN